MQIDTPKIEVQVLAIEHLQDITDLHYKTLHWSLTCRLGKDVIYQLYKILLTSSPFFGFVCYSEGKIVGFTTATLDYEKTRNSVSVIYERKLLKILFNILLHPLDFLILFESKFIIPRLSKKVDTKSEWLTLVTDIENKTLYSSVAFLLMRKTQKKFAEKGVKNYIGQVYANKSQMKELYTRFNGKILNRLLMNDFYVFYS